MLRRLSAYPRQNGLALALREVGRIERSTFMLDWLRDLDLRRRTRLGMGPCQGRQCGLTLTRILAAEYGQSPAETGFFRIRPPLKPVTLGELAALDEGEHAP